MKTNSMKWFFVGAFTVAASLSALAVVNIPNAFTAGQPIKASDVNDNFSSLKAAIDALQTTGLVLPSALEGTNPTAADALFKVSTKNVGTAIWGISNDPTNAAVGVEGDTVSSGGYGVYGVSRLETGSGTGVYGQAGSPDGIGVFGYNAASSGLAYGVVGKTKFGAAGVFGQSDFISGSGVEGHANGSAAAGAFGVNPTGPGTWGRSTSGNGAYGQSTSGYGVYGKTTTGGAGVYGVNTGNVSGSGVEGHSDGLFAAGTFGVNTTGPGAWGRSTSGSGVYGESTTSYGGSFKSVSGSALIAESLNTALIATTTGSNVTTMILHQNGNGSIIIARDAANAEVFRVGNDGSVFSKSNTYSSDRNIKTNFSSVNTLGVLEKIIAMPISQWNYKTDASNVAHIGPMAQDFHAAFGLNGSDDKHINTVDMQGVALAAIQGLYQQNKKLTSENAALKAQFKSLEARLAKLERK